jgi:AAA domain
MQTFRRWLTDMPLEIRKAVRRGLPLQSAFYGPSGSGKTFSALRFAAGLAGPTGKVVIIDTERGRGSLYADNKKILADLPGGYDVLELDAPYHPRRYIEAIDLCESNGFKVCLIDSASDSWDGPGGCSDIAEKAKGMWNEAKLWNKRMMSRIVLSDMHIVCCLKAQEKTKVIDKSKSASGKQEYIDRGVQPIWEKNNFYPMLLGFSVDPITHLSTCVKVHDDLAEMFKEPHLITKQDGERVRVWNEAANPVGDSEQLRKRSSMTAQQGKEAYASFVAALTPDQKRAIGKELHESNLEVAKQADQTDASEKADEVASQQSAV